MKNTFRALVTLQILIWLGTMVIVRMSFGQIQREYHVPSSVFMVSRLFGRTGDFVFLGAVIASLALLAFWNPARHIYTVMVVGDMLLLCLRNTVFRTGTMDAIHGADAVLTGVILSMIYLSPIRDVFMKREPAAALAEAAPPPFPTDAVAPPWPSEPSRSVTAAVPEPVLPPPWPSEPAQTVAAEVPEPVLPPRPEPAPAVSAQVCAACGAGDQDGKFCTQCGKPVAAPAVCRRCGTQTVPEEKFCRECGIAV
jgi:hypothetical protein